jgi:putative nucleotidyltransferase with HDIG domain
MQPHRQYEPHAMKQGQQEHDQRVQRYAYLLASSYGLPMKKVKEIASFASLHDIGKMEIPSHILRRPGKLSQNEWQMIKRHPEYGLSLLKLLGSPEIAINIALYHHERWDGSGYPANKKGQQIPIEARIVALADVYDALRSDRPYKTVMSADETEAIIFRLAGLHFDPKVVAAYQQIKREFRCLSETSLTQPHSMKNKIPNTQNQQTGEWYGKSESGGKAVLRIGADRVQAVDRGHRQKG